MKSFLLMLTFITRIPIKIKFDFEPDAFAKGLLYMPAIGALIGLPLWAFDKYVDVGHPFVRAFLIIILYLMMTGGLHLDGLSDYFDGIYSVRDRKRMLEIMADARIGAFGVIGLCIYFIGIFAGIIVSSPEHLLVMPMIGRTAAVMLCAFGKYPKASGMGKDLVEYGKPWMGILAMLTMIAICLAIAPWLVLNVIMVFAVVTIVGIQSTKRIGGVTGDVLGAAIEISQVTWLIGISIVGGIL